ncbi:MAG: hypothetical protein HOD99_09455 [Planctomycetaceae bacterium]|nr:hypothetical protein [Planctomycetaceae bacterium]MBT4886135.1 hypothetical protein [Planctomycetaceae bacterium]MBT6054310.1 hypothetical protein [Planctomycetaceae bacterium]MBT6642497.1 hypothetical protein [Planctomycetaceae bacterium]MBT6919248.1 hypothetical protein [Planctomycetaceae bacterium]
MREGVVGGCASHLLCFQAVCLAVGLTSLRDTSCAGCTLAIFVDAISHIASAAFMV